MTPFKILYDFTATLSLFPTENGGRKKSIHNNFRPSFSFNSVNHISGEIVLSGLIELHPGATATVMVKLLPSKHIRQNLKTGDSFSILEGNKVIGTGVIQSIQKEDRLPVVQ